MAIPSLEDAKTRTLAKKGLLWWFTKGLTANDDEERAAFGKSWLRWLECCSTLNCVSDPQISKACSLVLDSQEFSNIPEVYRFSTKTILDAATNVVTSPLTPFVQSLPSVNEHDETWKGISEVAVDADIDSDEAPRQTTQKRAVYKESDPEKPASERALKRVRGRGSMDDPSEKTFDCASLQNNGRDAEEALQRAIDTLRENVADQGYADTYEPSRFEKLILVLERGQGRDYAIYIPWDDQVCAALHQPCRACRNFDELLIGAETCRCGALATLRQLISARGVTLQDEDIRAVTPTASTDIFQDSNLPPRLRRHSQTGQNIARFSATPSREELLQEQPQRSSTRGSLSNMIRTPKIADLPAGSEPPFKATDGCSWKWDCEEGHPLLVLEHVGWRNANLYIPWNGDYELVVPACSRCKERRELCVSTVGSPPRGCVTCRSRQETCWRSLASLKKPIVQLRQRLNSQTRQAGAASISVASSSALPEVSDEQSIAFQTQGEQFFLGLLKLILA